MSDGFRLTVHQSKAVKEYNYQAAFADMGDGPVYQVTAHYNHTELFSAHVQEDQITGAILNAVMLAGSLGPRVDAADAAFEAKERAEAEAAEMLAESGDN